MVLITVELTTCTSYKPLQICMKVKYPLILKSITMIDPVTVWFEVMKCNNNKMMMINHDR